MRKVDIPTYCRILITTGVVLTLLGAIDQTSHDIKHDINNPHNGVLTTGKDDPMDGQLIQPNVNNPHDGLLVTGKKDPAVELVIFCNETPENPLCQ